MNTTRMLRAEAGMSLIELMVGIAIGLIVVAAASLAVTTQLGDNRRLLAETQLQQDLRAAADIITRELRRSGAARDKNALNGVWRPGMAGAKRNTYAEYQYLTSNNPVPVIPTRYRYMYQPTSGSDQESGFRLLHNAANNTDVIQQRLLGEDIFGGFIWQDVTDANAMQVLSFSITPSDQTALQLPCPKLCPDGTQDCWPTVKIRELLVSIQAQSKNFPEVQRTITSRVRVRNDYVQFTTPAADEVCPS